MDLYAPHLLRFARLKVQDRGVCEDLVQEAFIVLYEKLENVNPEKVKAFLFQVVANKIKDYYKLKKNIVEVESYHKVENSYNQQFETKDLIKRAMLRLDDRDQTIITLRDLEGYDYKEIGGIMELSDSQVKVYLFRARKKLKNIILKMEVVYE